MVVLSNPCIETSPKTSISFFLLSLCTEELYTEIKDFINCFIKSRYFYSLQKNFMNYLKSLEII